MLADTRKIM